MKYVVYQTRTGKHHMNGCELLKATLYGDGKPVVKDGKEVAVFVVSGWPTCQNFRTRAHQVVGRLEPIPEGVYRMGPVEWAGAPGNWDVDFPDIASPCFILLDPTRRILIHLDARDDGTAGCVGTSTLDDLERFCYWREKLGADVYIVDHGFGTVEKPRPPGQPAQLVRAKAWAHPGGARARVSGKDVLEFDGRLRMSKGKAWLTVNGKEYELASLELDAVLRT